MCIDKNMVNDNTWVEQFPDVRWKYPYQIGYNLNKMYL